jgi:hypothetical protein
MVPQSAVTHVALRRGPSTRVLLLVSVLALAGMSMFLFDRDQRAVVAPALVAGLSALVFFALLAHRSRVLPIDEIGTWYVAAVTVYTILPLVVFLALGLTYTPLNDIRLFNYQPLPDEVAEIGWYYATYLLAFMVAYLAVRGNSVGTAGALQPTPRSTIAVVVVLWVLANLFFLLIGLFYDLSAETYWEGYLAVQRLPLFVRQVYRLVGGVRLVLSLALLVWLFQNYRRWWWIIAIWVISQIVLTLTQAGERTTLMMLVASILILYHRLVRPLSARSAALFGVASLSAFLALGVYRVYRHAEDPSSFRIAISATEFESLFANSLDIKQRKASNELTNVPIGFYFGEFTSVIPSQVLPFEKVDPSDWYISTFYPDAKERGEGYVLGVVAQSLIGLGWAELIVRGVIVGAVFGWLHRYYRRKAVRLWILVGYTWMILWAYDSFRATTFYIITAFVQHLLFAILVVELSRAFLESVVPSKRRAKT